MIHYKLRDPDKIVPSGQKPNNSLSWFYLTDGDLWLKFGKDTLYEYSTQKRSFYGKRSTQYVDYYIVRFIEDFTELFGLIKETIPETFYQLTKDMKKYHADAIKWCDSSGTYHEEFGDLNEYEKLYSWINQRTLSSSHLTGGPQISFFRRNDKIRIVWDTERVLEFGISVWSAKNGNYEMNYADFVTEIKLFGQKFFHEMGDQVKVVVSKDWGDIKIDKQRLVEEHQERERDFFSALLLLEGKPTEPTDWSEAEKLMKRVLTDPQ